jgi:mannose-6-phosphate isomerase
VQVKGAVPVPQLLPLNQLEHFYRGGSRIAALRGGPVIDAMRSPEEWIASMTTMSAQRDRGLSRLADGTLLRDAVQADPHGWLGPAHVARFGPSSELLVKLLDAGQRLPVHLHPDREFARRHLSAAHGKTEAWIVLEADPGAAVRLGFAEPMKRSHVRELLDRGDGDALVATLREVAVAPGDTVLVPAGTPHCIDAGIFVLELQEPTDYSILLEARGFDLDLERDGHLGLGFDTALGALRLNPVALDPLVVRGPSGNLMPPAADAFFRASRLRDASVVPAGFAVVLLLSGSASLGALALAAGDAAVVPHAAGDWSLRGAAFDALVSRPPQP